ncbi:MAG: carbon-nitrogen hydrolase family protein [Candidatus Omnitrophica bacterium]|nr:carbon-nitrogen hydrolase family protein [Candidatus Omnitrophota bacterium]
MIRRYRVAAGCFEPELAQSIETRRESLKAHLAALLKEQKPDLVVLPELALIPDFNKQVNCGAELIDGPTIRCVAELAKLHGANICMPIIETDKGHKYNTAVYLNRQGQVAGKFRKHTPTKGELELDIFPGENSPEPVVIDGLRIGTAICYDENYPDLMWHYFTKGIDLLVFPAYTYGGQLMQSWALTCGVPLVVSFPWESVIYDRDGSILADGGTWTSTIKSGYHPAWVAQEINMQSRIYHLDYNQLKINELGQKYGNKIDIRLIVREARFRITVLSDTLDIDQIEKEMDLLPLQRYITEGRALADKMRK